MSSGWSVERISGVRVRARRVIVKARVVKLSGLKAAGATAAHLRYLQRDGVTREGEQGRFYSTFSDNADGKAFLERGGRDRHQFRFIVSPEDGASFDTLKSFTRELVAKIEQDLGTTLDWVAVDHFDTGHPHTHLLVRGATEDGKVLNIAGDYISRGIRGRASEIMTRWLGPQSELEVRVQLSQEIGAERLTKLDRDILARADDHLVDLTQPARWDGDGSYQQLLIGRVRQLERMGLAEREGPLAWRLDPAMGETLTDLGRRGDIIRTMHRVMTMAKLDRRPELYVIGHHREAAGVEIDAPAHDAGDPLAWNRLDPRQPRAKRLLCCRGAFQYDLDGRRTRTTWWDNFYVDYVRLVTGEIYTVTAHPNSTTSTLLATFGYDDLGNRTSATWGNSTSSSYSYDPVSRLTSLNHQFWFNHSNDVTISFGDGSTLPYTPAGQITKETISNDAYVYSPTSGSKSYTSNGLNQYLTAGSAPYDSNGNLTSDGTRTYAYDIENKLDSTLGGGPGTALYYDPVNRLDTYNNGTTTRFIYDGNDVAAQLDSSGNILRREIRGDGPDEVLVEYNPTDYRYYYADERGSTIATADPFGNRSSVDTYDEYGNPSNNANPPIFKYTGQMWLSDAGVYYYKARAYSAGQGRFLQTDPVRTNGGINLYNYTGNDPVNGSDPAGLVWPPVWCNGELVVVCGQDLSWFEFLNHDLFDPIRQRVDAGVDWVTREARNLEPKNTPCTGFFAHLASSAYSKGGMAQTAGTAVATAGALAQAGDVTPAAPATITVGGAAIVGGSSVAISGTVVQTLAGAYYLAHGNPKPIVSAGTSAAIDKVFNAVPNADRHPGVDQTAAKEAELAEDSASRKDDYACKPE